MSTVTLEPEVDPMIGRFAGKYQIVRKLGEGGMGAVYVGRHPVLGTERAIKTLKTQAAANREIAARFIGEARGAAAIKHPGIIEIEDVDRMEDGRGYIVMELLDGADCERLSNGQPMPLMWVFTVMVQALDALHAAHERGIIHRDLKPANLFVERADGRVKVLDFGIAKLLDPELAGGVRTATQMIAGTVGYMSPEQARGMAHVDRRADIFSMGVIFYVLVTGMRPWPADSLGDHVFHVTSTPLMAPNVYRSDLPPAWSALIAECLAAQPERRPPTARDVQLRLIGATPGPEAARVVERYLPSLLSAVPVADAAGGRAPASANGPGTLFAGATPTVAPGPRRRPWLAPALLAVVVAGGVGVTIASTQCRGREAAVAPLEGSADDAAATVAAGAASGTGVIPDDARMPDAGPPLPDAPPPDAAGPLDAAPPIDAPARPLPDASPARTGRDARLVGNGSLHVYVVPWAEVWLDGKPLGQTPVRVADVPAGAHTVRLEGADQRETVKITIRDKKTTTIRREWTNPP